MYFKQNRPSNKSASDSSTTNQFAPRPFKMEDSPAQDIVQAENLDTQPQKSQPEPTYRHIPVFAPNQVQPQPFSPRLQLKIDPNYQQDVYGDTLQQPSDQRILLQPKLTIGEPGDKYEVEADRIAKDVVQRINSTDNQVVQNQEQSTELVKQGQNFWLSRMSIKQPDYQPVPKHPRLQMKLSKQEPGEIQEPTLDQQTNTQVQPLIQRVNIGGMAASADVETGIQRARGSGQPLTDSIREPMEQAFGADFSSVRIHADSQADQLNQSIQAKAFTTGQDVFFRQGVYEPGSRGGQELIAHELTHVVQQNDSVIQPISSKIYKYQNGISFLQREINEKGKDDTTNNSITVFILPADFDSDIAFNEIEKFIIKLIKEDKSLKKELTFSQDDTVGDLAVFLDAHTVKLVSLQSTEQSEQADTKTKVKNKSLSEANFNAPLLNNGRYIVQSVTKRFKGKKYLSDNKEEMVSKGAAVTLVTDISSMLRRVTNSTEIQAMMIGKSVIVSSNQVEELANLKTQVGLEKEISKTSVKDFISKLAGKYRESYKNEFKFKQWDRTPVNDAEVKSVEEHFQNATSNVVIKNRASDLTSLTSELVIIYGHTQDRDTQLDDKEVGENKFTWHAEQNLLLALINYLAFTQDDKNELSGIVLGGHKSACEVCKEVLPIIKIALERLFNMEFHYAQKGNEDVHYHPKDAVSMVKSKKLHHAIKDILQSKGLNQDALPIEKLEEAVKLAYQIKESKEKWEKNKDLQISSSLELEQFYKDKNEDEIIQLNNCLITAMNKNQKFNDNQLGIIRNQVLGTVNIPIGHPLIDDQRVLQIIATVLGITNRYYQIHSTNGTFNRFYIDQSSQITFYPDVFPNPHIQIHSILHTPGIIGHFEYKGILNNS